MFLNGKAVLHVADTATHLSATYFLDRAGETFGQSVERIRIEFPICRCTMYNGYQNRMKMDQQYVFTSDRWKQLINVTEIQHRLSGV